jgi:hypothetical protein
MSDSPRRLAKDGTRRGRPARLANLDWDKALAMVSASGLNDKQVAEALGVSLSTWQRLVANRPDGRRELELVRTKAVSEVMSAMMDRAVNKGQPGAALLILKQMGRVK